ncbi:MAG: SGNH/GDSL hydrolase family protein [Acidobacteriota bacterium]|nr:SGNH/GDSL hydrolase family protein [Acidobacteriota bacterium]
MLRCSVLAALSLSSAAAIAAPPAAPAWVGTWGAAPLAAPNPSSKMLAGDSTVRDIVHLSLGGSTFRVTLSNEFGTESLTVGATQVALVTGKDAVSTTTTAAATFGGRASVTIPPGALVVSDPIALSLPAFADVAVSLYVPDQPISVLSSHALGVSTNYIVPGNQVGAASLNSPREVYSWPILKGVDVLAPAGSAAVVTLGDSITDGALSTRDANARWPDVLARRLAANPKTSRLAVLNEGISGNRVLHDNAGPSALARFDRDVLAQAGVKYLIILESINDIGHAADPVKPYDIVSADDLIVGLTQLALRAHTHGIKVYGATLTPYVGAKYQSAAGETMRQAVNTWIRTTKVLDGFIDFDKATQDPANPAVFAPAYDSGDHLHPKDAGYTAMGDSIDLNLFTR